MNKQMSLFDKSDHITSINSQLPLAHRVRPKVWEDFFQDNQLESELKRLFHSTWAGVILFGPPGVGKTTIAELIAEKKQTKMFTLHGVWDNKALLKSTLDLAKNYQQEQDKTPILFIDEIHRLNISAQDSLLPYVEKGEIILIGATTQIPRVSLNKALISRVRVIEIKQHSLNALMKILTQACQKLNITVDNSETLLLLAKHSSGDARFALGLLEESLEDNSIVLKKVLEVLKSSQRTVRDFDKQGDRHFDTISAFIKAMRGSDPQSALLWLAVMIEGGMDPLFIARRLIIFSSEDIGNADPQALVLSTSSLEALKHIGMPEGRIILSQVVTYLSCALKSNASYVAINEAQKYIEKNQTLKVPNHLKNHPPLESSHYLYPHDYPNNFVKQKYHQEDFPLNFYRPSEMGCEKKLKEWNEIRWGKLKE